MKKIKLYVMNGSYTIEAVFVVPIILGLIFAMIYILYYLHDRNIIYSNIQYSVINVAEGKKKYKNNKELQEDIKDNLWIFKITSATISTNKLYIKANVKAECTLDIPVLLYFLNNKLKIDIEDKYLIVHPENMIRTKELLSK